MRTQDQILKIAFNQHLKDILTEIPSNYIIFKKITGIGATTLEIENSCRNSILIEPNIPVIETKCKKYNNGRSIKLMGVYEKKTEEQIINYLGSSVQPKKFIVTPESFRRLKLAIESAGEQDVYKDYFLLFDECERTIQDVGYRADIILPMVDFFKFDKKAFISATPIWPSDPRFIKQQFTPLYIQPDFDYKEDIQLLSTNNVLFTFKKYIKENAREQYFIFLNSTDTIAKLINSLDIKHESAIFCAKESKQKLKVNDFNNVHTSLAGFRKFNFFTSRFFSAVDIDYDTYQGNPTIVMISDLVSAVHSMIDPLSVAIQIVGRFRKPEKGTVIREIVQISNYEPQLTSMTKEEVLTYLKECQIVHRVLKRFLKASTVKGAIDTLQEILERIQFARFLNPDGSKNYFMQDNMIHEEQVKGFYQSAENLKSAYAKSDHFNLIESIEGYELSDKDMAKTNEFAPLKTIYEVIFPLLKEIHQPNYNMFQKHALMEHLRKEYPKVVAIFNLIGYEAATALNFNHKKIIAAVKNKQRETSMFGLMQFIEENFSVNEDCSSNVIYQRLKRGIGEHKLFLLKPGVKLLNNYCKLSKRFTIDKNENGQDVKGYRILEIYNKRIGQ